LRVLEPARAFGEHPCRLATLHRIRCADAPERGFKLEPMSVATFYQRFMAELADAGIDVRIDVVPSEMPNPIRFTDDDLHRSYDAAAVNAF
jgi:hypothetical protein